MKLEDLIKSYTKRKAALEIWKASAVIKGTEKIVVQKEIQHFSKFIEELKNLNGETVKRSELISFITWFAGNENMSNSDDLTKIVDIWLKTD